MIQKRDKNEIRRIRHERVRKKISGTAERPRFCVYRSNKNIYVQVIDDTKGTTLCQASTLDKDIQPQLESVVTSTPVVWRRSPQPLARLAWISKRKEGKGCSASKIAKRANLRKNS